MAVPIKDAVKVNFSGDLDLKSDPKQIDASNFLALNNTVFTTGGLLAKRNGYASFSTTVNTPSPSLTYSVVPGTLAAARKVFSYNNELCLLDGFNFYSWDAGNTAWNYKGRITSVNLSTAFVVADSTPWTQADSSIDTTSGVKIFSYSTGGTVRYSIQDIVTGQFIVNAALFGTVGGYTNTRCVSISGKSWVFAVNISDGKLYYQAIVGQTVTGSPTALITNLFQSYTFFVTSASATTGATYTTGGNTYTVTSTIASGTVLKASGTAPPSSGSGTLTKASGTGDSTITFTGWFASPGSYDIDVDPHTGNIYIAYFNSSLGITVSALSTSMVVGNTVTKNSTSGSNGVSWFGDGTNIWVTYASGAAVGAFVVDNAIFNTIAAPTTIDSSGRATGVNNVTGVWSSTQSKAFFFYDPITLLNGSTQVQAAAINFNTATLSGATISPGTSVLFMGSLSLSSKAFAVSNIPHVMGYYGYGSIIGTQAAPTVIQPTNFLLNLYNVTPTMGGAANNDVIANIAGKVSPDEAQSTTVTAGILAGVHQNSSGAWELALLQNNNYGDSTNQFFPPTGVIDCQLDFSLSNQDVISLGNNAIAAGAAVTMYDSASIVEQNFHIYPNGINQSAGISNSGGNLGLASSNSLYSYIFTYEWIDNQGQIHRSFPSPATTPLASGQVYTFASGTTTGSVSLTVPNLRVTNKGGGQVSIVVYRTAANGSVYYRLFSVPNDPSTDTQSSIIDGTPDSTLIGNLQLYTTGGLGYYAPPATNALASYKNRAMGLASEDPYQVGYSNQVLQNFPVQFVPEFLQNIGTTGGAIITIANMDDKLIIFKNGKQSGPAIWYLTGQGPAPSGTNNDFQDPLPIAVDAGCVDRASVVLTPVGLMFKSNKGIYLIDRGLQATYIGAPVESYNQYSVLSAQLIPNSTQVRFMLSNGTLLMFDYFYKKWATWTPPAGVSDCIFQGQHTYVTSAGVVYQENPGIYVDGAAPVLMSFTTAWIQLAGLQGYQRAFFFYLLASYLSPHKLNLSLYTDFSTTPDTTPSITPDPANSLENWRVFFAKQRCQAFQIALSEVYTGTPGAGFTMSGLNLIVGAKSKFRTISAAESVG